MTEHLQEPEEPTQAPHVPAWFKALNVPQPLLGVNDARWIVLARRVDEELVGILIYEEHKELVFLVPEEALRTLNLLILWSDDLIDQGNFSDALLCQVRQILEEHLS